MNHGVVARFGGTIAVLPERGDRTENQTLIRVSESCFIESKSLHGAGLEILDNDIGFCGHLADNANALRIL